MGMGIMMMLVSIMQCFMDLGLAGISMMIGLGIFASIASILCSAAFLLHAIAKDVS